MKRRTFLKRSSLATIPAVLGGIQVSALNNPFFNLLNSDDDRVLILVQMSGGNDGLNMVIPKDQYAGMNAVRSNVMIPENEVLNLTDTLGFHPVMGGLKNVFDDAKLKIIQGVGYPNQNRSHFRSMDIWQTGSSAEEVWSTGWLGRYFDTIAPGYPTGYPNAEFTDPLAISVGSTVNETCEGIGGNFSLALKDPNDLSALATPVNSAFSDTCFGDKMDFLVTSIIQTNAYNEVLGIANENGANMATYNEENKLAEQLKLVARLISGGLKTKVYIVQLGGFDTHSDQVVDGETTTGEHAELLAELSEGIAQFQEDIRLLGLEERILGMTFSEFGRRIRSNASLGTDHGTAAPLMLFGSCVNAGIIGENPEVSPDVEVQEGVPMQFDFRSVYGSVLMDWFGLEEQTVKDLLFEDFQHIPLLQTCSTTSVNDFGSDSLISFEVYPNPFNDTVTLEFDIPTGYAKISLFDVLGHELKVLAGRTFSAGPHTMTMDGRDLAAGSYYYRIQTDLGSKVKRVVKVR